MDISTKASILVPISAPISPAEVFMHLENEAGDATNIREFQLVHFDDNVSVQISGVSKNRDSLIKFINILKQDTAFTGATFPYSSLAKQDNLGFTLNMILNLKNFNATTTKS